MELASGQQVQGTCLVVGAACVFALVALVVKTDPLPTLIATECRFLVSWIVAIAFMLKYRATRGLHWFGPPALQHWLLLKCAFSFTFITLWWSAIRSAPVGDCIAIIYTGPIVTSLLSRALLKEALHPRFHLQVLLVVIGMLLVIDPPGLSTFLYQQIIGHDGRVDSSIRSSADYTLVFCALLVNSFVPIITRQTRECSWIEVEHVSACLASTVLDPMLLLGQEAFGNTGVDTSYLAAEMSISEIGLIVLAAGGSFVGIALETKGYQLAEVGKASMFRYIEIPFAYMLQRLGTTAPLKSHAIVGSMLIVCSCFIGLSGVKAAKPRALAPLLAENPSKEYEDKLILLCEEAQGS